MICALSILPFSPPSGNAAGFHQRAAGLIYIEPESGLKATQGVLTEHTFKIES
jgi:hypothetical protein